MSESLNADFKKPHDTILILSNSALKGSGITDQFEREIPRTREGFGLPPIKPRQNGIRSSNINPPRRYQLIRKPS